MQRTQWVKKQENTVADTATFDKNAGRQLLSAGRQLLQSVALATDNFQPVADVLRRFFTHVIYVPHKICQRVILQ